MRIPQTNTRTRAGLTGLALVGVIVVGALTGSGAAAEDLTPKAYKVLVEQGLGNVRVSFDGREARLSNGTPEQLAEAEKVVEGVRGVRWAKVDTKPGSSLPKPPTLSITRNADGVNLSGVVPNAVIAGQLRDAAAATFGSVSGSLKVDRRVGTADWLITMPKLIPNTGDVVGLSLTVDGDSLAIGGSLGNQASIDGLTDLVEPVLGDLSLDNTLKLATGTMNVQDTTSLAAATVYFPRGSSILDDKARADLDLIADVLKRNPGVGLEIGGHAGPTNPARGKILSDERVATVKDYLVAAGVDAVRLTTRSYGSDPSSTDDAFAEQYRRVGFIVKGN